MAEKIKITIQLNKKTRDKLKTKAKITGKTISEIIEEMLNEKMKLSDRDKIAPEIAKLIGIAPTSKSYKEIRSEIVNDKIMRYENLS